MLVDNVWNSLLRVQLGDGCICGETVLCATSLTFHMDCVSTTASVSLFIIEMAMNFLARAVCVPASLSRA